jgi:hypothetical protein
MPPRKYPRIELDQLAYDALQIEAVMRKKPARAIASEAVLRSMSKDTLDFIGYKADRPLDQKTKEPEIIDMECHPVGDTQVCEVARPKKPKLSENPTAINRIKELWVRTPRPSIKAIADEIGYPKSTTAGAIERMKEKGELQEDIPQAPSE